MKQPNAIIGNSHMLGSVGSKAEIMALFYPRVDYAQNLHESMGGLFFDGRLWWTNAYEWNTHQDYLRNTNILRTQLSHPGGVRMTVTDFVLPDRPLLVRHYDVTSVWDLDCRFLYYVDPHTGEMKNKNSGYCDGEVIVAYWRDLYLGLRGDLPFDDWQVGKTVDVMWWLDAKRDAEDGHLHGHEEDIGDVNLAVGWDFQLKAGEPRSLTVYLLGARSRDLLHKGLSGLLDVSYSDLELETFRYWVRRVSESRRPIFLSGGMRRCYSRAALALHLLWDKGSGAFVAAPEFDPYFQQSGGYGFCWPRDASEVARALEQAGYHDIADSYYYWCQDTQLEDGSWFQRYWLDGSLAPSWCNFEYSKQLDQTASTIAWLSNHALGMSDGAVEEVWPNVLRGVAYLERRIDPATGLHDSCLDLWETFPGSHTYTNASMVAAFRAAADVADQLGDPRGARWRETAEDIKKVMLRVLWTGDYFVRRLVEGRLDMSLDACTIGVFEPFNVLSPHIEEERTMIEAVINAVERNLRVPVNGGPGIMRYRKDQYIGGNPWTVTTLWLAKAQLRLALYYALTDPARSKELAGRAESYVEWVIKGATSAGLIPEQVDRENGHPVWAIPLGWSCALFLDCLSLLDEVKHISERFKF